MTSEVDIVNRALDKLGAETIVSLTQDLENARIMNRAYLIVLDSLLRSHNWNCAIKRQALAPLSTTPVGIDFTYEFQLPSDCLRPIFPNDVTDWTIEGKKLLTNDGDTIYLRYISTLTDPNDMDSCFVDVFASKLAMECAEKCTQSATKRKLAAEEYMEALKVARKSNAFEKLPEDQESSSFLAARLGATGIDNKKVQH